LIHHPFDESIPAHNHNHNHSSPHHTSIDSSSIPTTSPLSSSTVHSSDSLDHMNTSASTASHSSSSSSESHDSSSMHNIPIIKKSSRIHKPPAYLEAYHCNLLINTIHPPCLSASSSSAKSCKYPLSSYLSYHQLSLHTNTLLYPYHLTLNLQTMMMQCVMKIGKMLSKWS
jgi:hypothetical protein